MQASTSVPTGHWPVASRMNPRIVTATVAVLAGHALLLTGALLMRNTVPERPLESKAITAQLLSSTPVAQPVGVQSAPTPKPKPEPKPQPKPTPKPVVKQAPTPLPVTHEPSPNAVAAPEPAPPAPPAPAAPPAAPAAAPARPTMEIAAPKGGASLSCQIVKANYPALSKRRGETGVAKVRFIVGVTGRIESAQIAQSSGFPRLDDAALEAVRASQCQPYLQDGQPMRAAYTQPYDFSLTD
jgi:periplasmic protein TonB